MTEVIAKQDQEAGNTVVGTEEQQVVNAPEGLNTAIKASSRAIGVAVFNIVLPYREQIGNRMFRDYVMYCIEDEIQTTSAATVYNHAKIQAVKDGLTEDFGRAVGEKIGVRKEVEEELDTEIREKMDAAIAQAHTEAQIEAKEKSDKLQSDKAAKQLAKDTKKAEREAKKAEREAKLNSEREAKKAEREAKKADKDVKDAEAKAKKEAAALAKKEAAEKAVEEEPENKWQVENKETGEVLQYFPTRKAASEYKKDQENSVAFTVKKIPA